MITVFQVCSGVGTDSNPSIFMACSYCSYCSYSSCVYGFGEGIECIKVSLGDDRVNRNGVEQVGTWNRRQPQRRHPTSAPPAPEASTGDEGRGGGDARGMGHGIAIADHRLRQPTIVRVIARESGRIVHGESFAPRKPQRFRLARLGERALLEVTR